MKRFSFILSILLLINVLSAQSQFDNLMAEGIKYHDEQEYFKAIEIYKQALEIDPNSMVANYEIALSYMNAEYNTITF